VKCPQCGSENLDGSTLCYSCDGDLTGEPPLQAHDAGGGASRIVWIVAGVAAAAVLLVAVFALSRPHEVDGVAPVSPAAGTAAESQAKSLDSIGRGTSAVAKQYQLTLMSLSDIATQNEAALEEWSRERDKRQTDYEAEKAAVERYNASHQGTPGTTSTTIEQVWDVLTDSWNYREVTRNTGGQPADQKPLPSPPEPPTLVKVALDSPRSRLRALSRALRKLQQDVVAVQPDATFANSADDAERAVALLQQRVREARGVLAGLVEKTSRGDKVIAKRLDVLQLQGIGEAIQALREDLQAAVANAGLDAAILKWATK